MKLQFDANQEFQLDAVRSVVDLFEGQPGGEQGVAGLEYDSLTSLRLTEVGLANNCVLTADQWLKNLQAVQRQNNLSASDKLEYLRLTDGSEPVPLPNFTVEMETGTGKTYVYLRTVHELHKTYGFRKFVIVVPSVAIREGVLKTLQITYEHFQTLYGFERVEFSVYDSSRVSQLRNFALSDALQILVINIDAFAKDSDEAGNARRRGNVINQLRETGIRPIEFIREVNPVVILDEPQNMETDKRKLAIARLNPMCTLRYSATHRETYNLVYSLDPVRAYELGLVKQISVDSVLDLSSVNQAFIELESFARGARSISAKATIWVNQAKGPKRKRVTLKNGSDLLALSNGREIYRDGFIVNEIDAEEGFVRFANDATVRIGVPHGALSEDILRQQIEATVRRHFEKARKLEPLGIKVLSVFFIDRVSSYRVYNADGTTTLGPFGQWFEEIYERYRGKPEYAGLYTFDKEAVHNGYFAQDRKAVSPYGDTDYRTKSDAEGGAFELIMRDKERLLDAKEPLRFIFSHSALREGWDNPNVFQICTLAESGSEIKKRQEIGRGLRLCVNQEGRRVFDRAVNRLTVIANETYEDFALQLQTEMEQDGVEFRKEMVQNERDKVTVHLRKGYQTDPEFLALWKHIRQRTRYRVQYATAELIEKAANVIRRKMPAIERPKISITRSNLRISRRGVAPDVTNIKIEETQARFVIPDLIGQVQAKTGLSRSTVASILLEAGRLDEALNNPQAYGDNVVNLINAVKREMLVEGVEYLKLDDAFYEMRRFEDDDLMVLFKSNVFKVSKLGKTLFSYISIDSNSGPERRFAQACESNDDVLFYIKLPRWFVIETPVGEYSPDWALAYRNDETLYFVAETKSADAAADVSQQLLRPLEQLKIECGKRHFRNFEQVRFRVVNRLDELLTQ
ncbi:MAG: DEAD/DEAH box helicase family protein [Gammaproteobacteria bacterium]